MHPAPLPLASLSPFSIVRGVLGRLSWFGKNLVALLPLLATSLGLSLFIVTVLIPRRTSIGVLLPWGSGASQPGWQVRADIAAR